jgi:hypothetical protein
MLDPLSRGAIVAMSVVCISGAVALTPLRARSSNDPNVLRQPEPAPLVATAVREITIRRDPFAGEPSNTPAAGSTTSRATSVSTPPAALAAAQALPGLPGGDIGPLPGNLTNSTIPALPGAPPAVAVTSRVTAIVTGARPYAMFDSAGYHEIKGVGDRVNGTPITAIDIDGVTLQSGARLRVAGGELPQ